MMELPPEVPVMLRRRCDLEAVKGVLARALELDTGLEEMDEHTPLLGALPELDSIGVLSLITALEEHFGIVIADDEISAANFQSLGSLAAFVQRALDG